MSKLELLTFLFRPIYALAHSIVSITFFSQAVNLLRTPASLYQSCENLSNLALKQEVSSNPIPSSSSQRQDKKKGPKHNSHNPPRTHQSTYPNSADTAQIKSSNSVHSPIPYETPPPPPPITCKGTSHHTAPRHRTQDDNPIRSSNIDESLPIANVSFDLSLYISASRVPPTPTASPPVPNVPPPEQASRLGKRCYLTRCNEELSVCLSVCLSIYLTSRFYSTPPFFISSVAIRCCRSMSIMYRRIRIKIEGWEVNMVMMETGVSIRQTSIHPNYVSRNGYEHRKQKRRNDMQMMLPYEKRGNFANGSLISYATTLESQLSTSTYDSHHMYTPFPHSPSPPPLHSLLSPAPLSSPTPSKNAQQPAQIQSTPAHHYTSPHPAAIAVALSPLLKSTHRLKSTRFRSSGIYSPDAIHRTRMPRS